MGKLLHEMRPFEANALRREHTMKGAMTVSTVC